MDRQMITEQMEQAEKLIKSSTLTWFIQMNHVREAFDSCIACLETKAEGETVEAVSSYIEEIHKYLLNQFYSLFTEMNNRIVQYVREIPKDPSESMNEYETVHLKADFNMMENMMAALENLIGDCRKAGTARIRYYQKGSIRNYEGVWELERLAKKEKTI